MTIRIGLREANQNFSKAVKAIKAGNEIVLTERGNAIAVIHPLTSREDPEAIIQRLRETGFLRAASPTKRLPPFNPRPIRGGAASHTLHKERNES